MIAPLTTKTERIGPGNYAICIEAGVVSLPGVYYVRKKAPKLWVVLHSTLGNRAGAEVASEATKKAAYQAAIANYKKGMR